MAKGMETGVARLKHIGKVHRFDRYWPNVDKHRWPWREFYWVWCHPILAFMLFSAVIAELVIFILYGWPANQ